MISSPCQQSACCHVKLLAVELIFASQHASQKKACEKVSHEYTPKTRIPQVDARSLEGRKREGGSGGG